MTGLRTLGRTPAASDGDQPALPAGRWTVDRAQSTVAFRIRHLTVATVRGGFERFDGWLQIGDSGVVAGGGTVETASVSTGDTRRDSVLLEAGFFDASRYPTISLSLTDAELQGREVTLVGELTMKGVTRPVRFTGTADVIDTGRPGAGGRGRIVMAAAISRAEFGVTGGGVIESHGAVVSDTVKVELDISVIRQTDGGR